MPRAAVNACCRWGSFLVALLIYSFLPYTLSNPQIRCVAADILWPPSSLPCAGISSTM